MHKKSLERGNSLLSGLEEKPSLVVRHLSSCYSEERGYGRFLNNDKISAEDIVSHYLPDNDSFVAGRHVLLVGDSSSANFGYGGKKTGLAEIDGCKLGFYLHSMLALDAADGGCYGLADAQVWSRNYFDLSEGQSLELEKIRAIEGEVMYKKRLNTLKTIGRYKEAFSEKEDYRWLSTAYAASARYSSASKRTIVCDSETDCYEIFAGLVSKGLDFVLRCWQDRRLMEGENGKLKALISQWEVKASQLVELPATDHRSAHTANLNISWGKVRIPKPKRLKQYAAYNNSKDLPDDLELTIVYVKESPDSVVGQEKPIEWILITTHEVSTLDQALQIIQFYRWRWLIEQLFRLLKSEGLDIEKCEFRKRNALVKFAILGLIAAGNILKLVQARDGKTQQNAEQLFNNHEIEIIEKLNQTLEGKTIKQKNPHNKKSLAFAAWVIARIGGWKGYKSLRPPGPITFLNGLTAFYNIVKGAMLYDT